VLIPGPWPHPFLLQVYPKYNVQTRQSQKAVSLTQYTHCAHVVLARSDDTGTSTPPECASENLAVVTDVGGRADRQW